MLVDVTVPCLPNEPLPPDAPALAARGLALERVSRIQVIKTVNVTTEAKRHDMRRVPEILETEITTTTASLGEYAMGWLLCAPNPSPRFLPQHGKLAAAASRLLSRLPPYVEEALAKRPSAIMARYPYGNLLNAHRVTYCLTHAAGGLLVSAVSLDAMAHHFRPLLVQAVTICPTPDAVLEGFDALTPHFSGTVNELLEVVCAARQRP